MPTDPVRHLRLHSDPEHLTLATEFKQNIAVVIGINDYANGIPRLTTAVNDARRLAAILQQEHAYQVHLIAEDASRQRLGELFTQTLPQTVGEQDRLLFYFAGHGVALDGDDGPAGYLIPQDAKREERATFLAMTELHQWLTALPCRHLLAIFDCCFAGAFRWASTRTLAPLPAMIYRERYDRFLRDPAWQVITSAAYDQTALDFLQGDPQRGSDGQHSPFANALFTALAGAGDLTPHDGDGVMTATELYLYLRDCVEVAADLRAGHRQTPGLWPLKKHDKGEFIFHAPGKTINLPPAPPLTTANNPYRGLEVYTEEHKALFFGRTNLIEELATCVAHQPLTVVLGASGTGKSSLVRAGLLPHLRQAATANREKVSWCLLPPMRPAAAPLRALNHLLTTALPRVDAPVTTDVGEVTLGQAIDTSVAIPNCLADWFVNHPEQHLLLVVDQFEELITLCRDDERRQFITLLTALLDRHRAHLHLVLTLRSDFEPQFANSSLFTHTSASIGSAATRFITPPLNQAELRQVIEGPATARVLYFDPASLVDKLIDEVIQTPGALPLLSFTLSELYLKYLQRQADGRNQGLTIDRALIHADYQALGGVIGSLSKRATEVYAGLDAAHQATLQRVILRMLAVEGGELARRRAPLPELVYMDASENQQVAVVIQELVAARLLVTGNADTDADGVEDSYVEPAHDALVRAWDNLLVWKRSAEEYLPLQRRLTQAANEWARAAAPHKTGLLWNNNPRLEQLQQVLVGAGNPSGQWSTFSKNIARALWPATGPAQITWLNHLETTFVQQSVSRRTSLLRRLVTTTIVIILALSGLTLWAEVNRRDASAQRDNAVKAENAAVAAQATAVAGRNEAQRQTQRALSRQLAAQAQTLLDQNRDAELALLLAIEAVHSTSALSLPTTAEADASLRRALEIAPLATLRAYFGRGLSATDKGILWTSEWNSDTESGVDLWDVFKHVQIGHYRIQHDFAQIALRSAGQWVMIVEPGLATLWDTSAQQIKATVPFTGVFADSLLSADAAWLATSIGSTVELHNLLSEQQITWQGPGPVKGIVLNGAKQLAATIYPAGTVVLRGFDGQTQTTLSHPAEVSDCVFNQAGTLVATSDTEGVVRVWEVTTGKERHPSQRPNGKFDTLTFVKDGERLLLRGGVHLLVLDVETGTVQADFTNPDSWLHNIMVSPDGRRLVTTNNENMRAILWDISTITVTKVAELSHSAWIRKVVFTQDGTLIATAALDGTARLWDAATGDLVKTFSDDSGLTDALFSSDGNFLVTENENGAARTWPVGSADSVFTVYDIGATTAALQSDDLGKKLVITGQDDQTRVYQLSAQSQQAFSTTAKLDRMAISPDQHLIATFCDDNCLQLRKMDSGQLVKTLPFTHTVDQGIFNPDGRYLLIVSKDSLSGWEKTGSAVYVWRIPSGELVAQLPHEGTVQEMRFSPDGQFVATSSVVLRGVSGLINTNVQVWQLADGVLRATFPSTTALAAIAFTDQATVLALYKDGALYEWSMDSDRLVKTACQKVSRNLTEREWLTFVGATTPYRATCP